MRVDKFDLSEMGIGLITNTWAYIGVGYLYGFVTEVDPHLTAQAFAVTAFANTIFKILVDLATGGKEERPKTYYVLVAMGEVALGTIQILAMREFGLIGHKGTLFLSGALYLKTIYYLFQLADWSQPRTAT